MSRAIVLTVVAVLALGLLAELVAVPVATRRVDDIARRCFDADVARVVAVDRPAAPGLALGRATGVELEVTGAVVGGLRVDRADVALPEVSLPWAIGGEQPVDVTARIELTRADLQAELADRAPFGLEPVLELAPGIVAIGVEPLPFTLDLEVEVRDGVLRLAPADRLPAWFTSLGIDLEFDLPADVDVDDVEVLAGRVVATVRIEDLVLGEDRGGGAGAGAGPGGGPLAAAVVGIDRDVDSGAVRPGAAGGAPGVAVTAVEQRAACPEVGP